MLVIQRPTVEAAGEAEGNRQQFTVGPLEPGFGYTIGNSLRRTLLSSIPGAAITTVRFDDALHEFDTIAGVAEDVTDIILNLKDIVLTSSSEEPVVIRLDIRGPADVAAGDIKLPPEIEILNRDAHIATVNAKGRLAVDLTVERGRGYLSSDRESQARTIGVVPIDAIFSPVRRVTFTVEPTRVEQSTNYDRLLLDIETDGSITPKEALASAGATLRSLVDLVANLSDDPQGLELGEVAAVSAGSPDLDLPQAGPGQHHRRAAHQDRGRPAEHHQLRAEEPGRGEGQAGRARSDAAGLRRATCPPHAVPVASEARPRTSG